MRTARASLRFDARAARQSQRESGQRIVLPARFEQQGEDWKEYAWSIVATLEGPPDTELERAAVIQFLMPNAPQEWLEVGNRFCLMEGEIIAEGEITEILLE